MQIDFALLFYRRWRPKRENRFWHVSRRWQAGQRWRARACCRQLRHFHRFPAMRRGSVEVLTVTTVISPPPRLGPSFGAWRTRVFSAVDTTAKPPCDHRLCHIGHVIVVHLPAPGVSTTPFQRGVVYYIGVDMAAPYVVVCSPRSRVLHRSHTCQLSGREMKTSKLWKTSN